MAREQQEENKVAKVEVVKPPFKTPTEAVLYITNSFMNPTQERMMEFTNMKEGMVFPMVLSKVRERAADPHRNRLLEPLSGIMRFAYCQARRGIGFKTTMLGGNLVLGGLSSTEDEMPAQLKRNI